MAGGAGIAAAVLLALRSPLPEHLRAATAVFAIAAGWTLMNVLAPWRAVARLDADRRAVRHLTHQLRRLEDTDIVPDLRLDRDDIYGDLAQQIHLALARHAAVTTHNRTLRRTMNDRIKHETSRATMQLRQEAQTDPLTRLGNRRAMRERLAAFFATTDPNSTLSAMLIDIDHFKLINDTLGHEAGDACLRFLGELLASCLRKDDAPIRVGGDEFLILIRDAPIERTHDLAERLSALMGQMPWPYEGVARPTLSIGLARATPDIQGGEATLLRHADEALYQAKRGGRNRIQLYSQAA